MLYCILGNACDNMDKTIGTSTFILGTGPRTMRTMLTGNAFKISEPYQKPESVNASRDTRTGNHALRSSIHV